MDWTTLLFSFNGRINRGKYWLAVLIYMVVWTTFIAGSLIWLGGLNFDNLLRLAGAGTDDLADRVHPSRGRDMVGLRGRRQAAA